MKPSFTLFVAAMACTFISFAQQPSSGSAQMSKRSCGSEIPSQQWENWFGNKISEHKALQQGMKGMATTHTIPVIVHVIHGGENVGTYPNLSKAQINSQIGVLNNDFAGTGLNVSQVPAAFASLVANCGITFSLALLDTLGNLLPEPGIDRVNYVTKGWQAPTVPSNSNLFQTYFNSTVKPNTIWDPSRYLNIWVSDKNSSMDVLGYATFPAGSGLQGLFGGGTATDDGVWIWGKAFGDTGTLDSKYDEGRTTTHELGHWLGLRHITGDASCGNDYCGDTPQALTLNGGCPSYPLITCNNWPTGEMYMNFMDYCDDPCLYMFTHDQNARMQTAMTNGVFRKDLTASSATLCSYVATKPETEFVVEVNGCLQYGAYITNQSVGFPPPTFSWSAVPADGVSFDPSSTAQDPTVTVLYPGNYQIVLAATNEAGTTTEAQAYHFADCNNATGIGTDFLSSSAIRLIPNPASDEFRINILSPGTTLTIQNTLGQTVFNRFYAEERGEVGVNTEQFPDGIYTVSVASGGQSVVKRLIISR
jgi:hypothetical protein